MKIDSEVSAIFRQRLPSRRDLMYGFAASVLLVNVWSILVLLRQVPTLLLRLSLADLVGVIAYNQAFALLESTLVLLALIVLAIILPGRRWRQGFAAYATLLLLVSWPWALVLNLLLLGDEFTNLGPGGSLLLLAAYLAWVGAAFLLIARHNRLERALTVFIERVVVLSAVYLAVDLMSLVIVLLRNL